MFYYLYSKKLSKKQDIKGTILSLSYQHFVYMFFCRKFFSFVILKSILKNKYD